ncbi:hypothetical protein ACJX0J_028851, partial [Zea mays]
RFYRFFFSLSENVFTSGSLHVDSIHVDNLSLLIELIHFFLITLLLYLILYFFLQSWMLKRVIINFEFVMLKIVNNNLIETAYKYRSHGDLAILSFFLSLNLCMLRAL